MQLSLTRIRQDTVFETLAGSHAHGLATPASDRDRRGVCLVRQPAHYLGLNAQRFEQQESWEAGEDDLVIYEFRKAMRLFADGNPNMVEMLFSPARHHSHVAAAFRPVLAARGALVTRRLGQNFIGYGRQQLEAARRQRLQLSDPQTIDALLARLGERRRTSFDRTLGYDTKRAMHAVRALTMAEEILTLGEVRVERVDAERLLAVRAGAWSFDAFSAWGDEALAHLPSLVEASPLPAETDVATWEALTVATIEASVWPAVASRWPPA